MNPIIRIHFIVEGQTEEAFVNQILKPYFLKKEIYIYPQVILTRKNKNKKYCGGVIKYNKMKEEIIKLFKEDTTAYLTTMIDFYALPKEFPGWNKAQKIPDIYQKVICLEETFKQDIEQNTKIDIRKFIPYIQLHEFEALLFTNPKIIDQIVSGNLSNTTDQLETILKEHETPEHIDQENPPSKILENIYPKYKKVLFGPRIAKAIGIEQIKAKCQHFCQWLKKIEAIQFH